MTNTIGVREVIRQMKDTVIIELLPVTQTVAEQAAQVASGHRIRGCDAVYNSPG